MIKQSALSATKICLLLLLIFLDLNPLYAMDEYAFETLTLGKWGSKPGEFGLGLDTRFDEAHPPHDIAFDRVGNIYVADQVNGRVQVVSPQGKLLSIFLDEKNKRWLMGVTGIAVLSDNKIFLHNSSLKQFGYLQNNQLVIKDGIYEGYFTGDLCTDKITLEERIFDSRLNEIPRPISSHFMDSEGDFYNVVQKSGDNSLQKVSPDKKVIYDIPVEGSGLDFIIGVDVSDHVYLLSSKRDNTKKLGYTELIIKLDKKGNLVSRIDLGPFMQTLDELTSVRRYKVSCNGDIYRYHHLGDPGTDKTFAKKGFYQIYRFTLRKKNT